MEGLGEAGGWGEAYENKKFILTAALVAASLTTYAQVGVGTTSPDASAALDVTSTTKGFLSPRMTTTQRDAIATPAVGLQVYNTTTNQLQVNIGTTVVPVWANAAGTNAASKFVYNPTRTSTDLQYISDGVTLRSAANFNTVRIKDDGGIAVGYTGTTVPTSTRIASYVNKWNHATTSYNFYSTYALPQITADQTISVYDISSNPDINIAAGITASGGGLRGINGTIVRNTTGDAGTLSALNGANIQYGNGANTTGTTTNAYGYYANPYAQAGLVANMYDYYAANTTGSNVTNAWGLYITGSNKKNYVQGALGIGTNANLGSNSAGNTDLFMLDVSGGDAEINGLRVGRGKQNNPNNTVLGSNGALDNATGNYNVAVGKEAAKAVTTGSSNVAVGFRTLWTNTDGTNNIALGAYALRDGATGSYNIGVGYTAGILATGTGNVFLGRGAGDLVTTGSNNIAIGNNANLVDPLKDNQLNIGDGIMGTNINALNTSSGAGALFGFGARSLLTSNTIAGNVNYTEVDNQPVIVEQRIGNNYGTTGVSVLRLQSYGNNYNTGGGSIMFTNVRNGSLGENSDLAAIKSSRSDDAGATVGSGNLRFFTSNGTGNLEQLRITNTGNVGVGTTTPAAKLDVNGMIKVGTSAATPVAGMIKYETGHFYGYTGSAWVQLDN